MQEESKVRGVVHLVEEIKTYGNRGFRKRVFVLEQGDDRFPNYIPMELVQADCELADQLTIGDEVEVSYRLRGRKWQRDDRSEPKYFLNAEAYAIHILGADEASRRPPPPADDDAPPPFEDDDEIPF